MKRSIAISLSAAVLFAAAAAILRAQISGVVNKEGGKAAIAVPDFRGSGPAQPLMDTFNATLFSDIQNSGIFKMVPKTFMPLQIPQQPSDFRPAVEPGARGKACIWATGPGRRPTRLISPSDTPRRRAAQLVLYGWLYNVHSRARPRAPRYRQGLYRHAGRSRARAKWRRSSPPTS